MKLDPNEAPDGYVAEASTTCNRCDFFKEDCSLRKCMSYHREDGVSVIFKKREDVPETTPSRADEYALFRELLRIAGNINRSNNIVANIQRLEEIAEALDHTDYATPRKSFAIWVADRLNEERSVE